MKDLVRSLTVGPSVAANVGRLEQISLKVIDLSVLKNTSMIQQSSRWRRVVIDLVLLGQFIDETHQVGTVKFDASGILPAVPMAERYTLEQGEC